MLVLSLLLHQWKCIETRARLCHFVALLVITSTFLPSCLFYPYNGHKGCWEDMRTCYLEVVVLWTMYKHQDSLPLGKWIFFFIISQVLWFGWGLSVRRDSLVDVLSLRGMRKVQT